MENHTAIRRNEIVHLGKSSMNNARMNQVAGKKQILITSLICVILRVKQRNIKLWQTLGCALQN